MTKAPRLALLLSLLLVSCAEPDPVPPPLTLDFSSLGKISLDVHDISFIDQHTSQLDFPPYAADQFHPGFNEAVRHWSNDRLQATGATGDATVVVHKANLAIASIPTKITPDSLVERQQDKKYTGTIQVDVQVRGQEGYAYATAEASRYVTLPEDATQSEKQAAYNSLLAGLMQDLNRNLDQAIHQHLADFLITSAPVMDNSAPMLPMAAPESPGMAP